MNFLALWLGFLLLWKIAPGTHRVENPMLSLLLYSGIALMLFNYPKSPRTITLCAIFLCFAFAAYARYELGDNWSGARERVSSGPYAILNHPIYTAIGLALLLSAVEAANSGATIGAGMAGAALVAKASEEDGTLANAGEPG